MADSAVDLYSTWLSRWESLFEEGAELPPPETPTPRKQVPLHARSTKDRRRCLILSPHPDDEAIHAGLPLRLALEAGWEIVNLAVTFGSNTARRAERLGELEASCAVLGFALAQLDATAQLGLDSVTPDARHAEPTAWYRHIERLAASLTTWGPDLVLAPHAADAHPTHAGCHWLLRDAIDLLRSRSRRPPPWIALTDYWAPLETPNLLIGLDRHTVAMMLAALVQHRGEVARNPYHLSLPAWLVDNVRWGSERLSGAGSAAAPMRFGVLLELFAILPTGWHRWSTEDGRGALCDVTRPLSAQMFPPALHRTLRT